MEEDLRNIKARLVKLEPHDREIILLKEEVRELKEQESAQEKAYGKLKEEVLLLRARVG